MIRLYVDAAFSNGEAAGAYVLYKGSAIREVAYPIEGARDNHEAEFLSMIEALTQQQEDLKKEDLVLIYSDSQVVVKALERQSVKNDWQKPYLEQLLPLLPPNYLVDWFSDKRNGQVDQLAKAQLRRQGLKKKGKKPGR